MQNAGMLWQAWNRISLCVFLCIKQLNAEDRNDLWQIQIELCAWLCTKTAMVRSHLTLSTPFHCCRLCSQFCVFTKRWQIMRLNPFTWFPCLCRKLLSLCYIICRTTPQNPFLNVITQVEDDSATIKMLLWIYGGDMLIFLNWKRGSFSGTL